MATKLNVGIIGGGLSGLTTAYELYQQLSTNVNVTIIEKESQLGGRIFTKKFKDCPIELGAQFFIEGGTVQRLVKSLDLESDTIPLDDNFISFYYDNMIYSRKQLSTIDLLRTREGNLEKEKLLSYARKVDTSEDLISSSFEEWYRTNIGENLLSFWNRMLMSIGVRDIRSIDAYFGLILVNVFFGKNYLLKNGLDNLISKLSEKVASFGGKILLDAECKSIEKINNKYQIEFEKDGKTKKMLFDKVISAVRSEDLIDICDFDALQLLQKIDSHPMTLYVITSNVKLWDTTWGLVISDENNPVYALCDWKNITNANKETPILAICSPSAKKDEVISELKNLFPKVNLRCKIIFEKKWDVGLHQPGAEFFKIQKIITKRLPSSFYLAGDWMVLPALEGAVVSAMKAVKLLISEEKVYLE